MSRKQATSELVKDIFAFAVLLVRLGHEDCVTNKSLFVEMLNEARNEVTGEPSFRTPNGQEFTKQQLNVLIARLPSNVKEEIKEEFSDAMELLNYAFTQRTSAIASDYMTA